jgi:hypothetical protein
VCRPSQFNGDVQARRRRRACGGRAERDDAIQREHEWPDGLRTTLTPPSSACDRSVTAMRAASISRHNVVVEYAMSNMQNNENNVQKNAAAQTDQQKEQERKDTLARQQKQEQDTKDASKNQQQK